MDVTDFTKGVVTDFDPQDAPVGSLRESVNFVPHPGRLEKRYGTTERTFDHYEDENASSPTGQVPYPNEEVIQIAVVHAPDAKSGSVKDFRLLSERCFNQHVTFVLVKMDAPARTYRVYADIYEQEKFIRLPINGAVTEFLSYDDDDPVMVPFQSCVDIGNVDNNGDPAVLWIGHIKKLIGWARNNTSKTYGYLDWIDEWRASWAECFDSAGDIKCELVTSIYEQRLRSGTDAFDWFDLNFNPPPKTIFRKVMDPFLIGKKRNFNIKVTAEYDGFQESRPLRWNDSLYRSVEISDGTRVYGDDEITVVNETYDLPTGWTIKRDEKHNQYARIECEPPDRFCTIEVEDEKLDGPGDSYNYSPMLSGQGLGSSSGGTVQTSSRPFPMWIGRFQGTGANRDDIIDLRINIRWNGRYVEDGDITQNGEGFKIYIHSSVSSSSDVGSYGEGFYGWKFDGQGRRTELHLYPRNSLNTFLGTLVPTTSYMTLGLMLYLLGVDVPFNDIVGFSQNQMEHIRAERDIVRSMFTVYDWEATPITTFTSGHPGYPTSSITIGSLTYSAADIVLTWLQYGAVTEDSFTWEFKLSDRVGLGLLAVNPIIPREYFPGGGLSSSGSQVISMNGARRLTAFKIYVKEDDVDIDYRLIRRIPLDFDEANPNHGGFGEPPDDEYDYFRELTSTSPDASTCPVWMDDGTNIVPYFKSPFAPTDLNGDTYGRNVLIGLTTQKGYYIGLTYRAGMNRAFLLSDQDFTDAPGLSLLSANLLRDETETDAPRWKRAAVLEGRLFGIKNDSTDIQYSLIGGGVAQHNIMPGDFYVSKNEKPTAILSWRGRYHLIFTDQNLWRIDLADGDEFNWRILDTYAQQGTELYKTIVESPDGVFYVNSRGIWVYAGDKPASLTDTRWGKDFYRNYRRTLSPTNSWAGYNPFDRTIHFVLDPASHDYRTWVFYIDYKSFYQFKFANSLYPRWMGRYENEFYMTFGAGDLRTFDNVYWYDRLTSGQYGVHAITNELPPPSEVQLPYWQYIGLRYETFNPYHMRAGVIYEPYHSGLTSPAQYFRLPALHREDIAPLPFGISRGIQVVFGQGEYFNDDNSSFGVIFSSISLRGATAEKWQGATQW